jgi:hypothetical protein
VVSTYSYDPANRLTGVAYTIPAGQGIAAMYLQVSAATPGSVPGAFQWVQIITTRNQQFKNSNNTGCSNCAVSNQLDNVYPYPGQLGAS